MKVLARPQRDRPPLQRLAARAGLAMVALVVIAGIGYALILGDRLRYPDESEYLQLASNLATTGRYTFDGVHPTAMRPPGYPIVLAPAIRLGGAVVAARLLNFVALAASLLLLQHLLRRHGFPLAAAIGTALALGYPVLFYTAGTLYPQTLGATLLLLALVLATRQARPWWGAILGGLAYGLLILTISPFALKLPVVLLAVALARPADGRRWRVPLVLGAVALLVVGGWAARNAFALRAFVPLATNTGINLLLGNSENARPNSGVNTDIGRYEAAAGLGEVERDAYFQRSALTWVMDHPGAATRLYALKVINYFNYRNDLYVASEGSRAANLLMALTYGPLLLLFAVRLALARPYPLAPLERALALLYLANPFLDALAFTRIRFRLPFDLVLIAAVAIFLETLYRRHQR